MLQVSHFLKHYENHIRVSSYFDFLKTSCLCQIPTTIFYQPIPNLFWFIPYIFPPDEYFLLQAHKVDLQAIHVYLRILFGFCLKCGRFLGWRDLKHQTTYPNSWFSLERTFASPHHGRVAYYLKLRLLPIGFYPAVHCWCQLLHLVCSDCWDRHLHWTRTYSARRRWGRLGCFLNALLAFECHPMHLHSNSLFFR